MRKYKLKSWHTNKELYFRTQKKTKREDREMEKRLITSQVTKKFNYIFVHV